MDSIYPRELIKLTHQHCADLATKEEVAQVIDFFLESLKLKLANLETVFVTNFGAFSPKLLSPKKSLQHWVTKERRPIGSKMTVRFRFTSEMINLIKLAEKIKSDK